MRMISTTAHQSAEAQCQTLLPKSPNVSSPRQRIKNDLSSWFRPLAIMLMMVAGMFSPSLLFAQTPCTGNITDTADGTPFVNGFDYEFITNADGDITINVELLDTQTGLVAFAQTMNPNFAEMMMSSTGGQSFTITYLAANVTDPFNVAIKFAFAGGLSTSPVLNFAVDDCLEDADDSVTCTGNVTDTADGTPFVNGFDYEFITNADGDVIINVELLDTQTGLVAFAQTMNPNFAEMMMSSTGGQSFTITYLAANVTNPFNVAIKFAFAGGLSTSPVLTFIPGGACPGEEAEPTAAPTPDCDPADVISMFSDAYADVPVDTWLTPWSSATGGNIVSLGGNDARLYENVDFLGIETVANPIDASTMTSFHIDVWTPNMTTFRVKLVDFDPSGTTEGEIALTPVQSGWNTFVIPMADFFDVALTTGPALANSMTISQLILSGLPVGEGTLYVDNIYFSNDSCPLPTGPTAAPDPTCGGEDVISMFSDAYVDVPVDTWLTPWSSATGGGIVDLGGNDARLYENVDFLGIETFGSPIDASAMTTFHIDVWTPNMNTFRVKLVDFDPSGTTEGEIALTPVQSGWNTFVIPMADFFDVALTTGPALANSMTISQLILSGLPVGEGTLYIDNVYYSSENCPEAEPISLEISDPCNCDSQITVAGVVYAQETITITPGVAPYTVTAIEGLYDAAGVLYDPATATAAIAGTTLIGYVPADNAAVYSITIADDNSNSDSLDGGPCPVCPPCPGDDVAPDLVCAMSDELLTNNSFTGIDTPSAFPAPVDFTDWEEFGDNFEDALPARMTTKMFGFVSGVQQDIPVTPGEWLCMDAQAITLSGDDIVGTNIRGEVKVEFYDAGGVIINGPFGTVLGDFNQTVPAVADQWTNVGGCIQTPDNAVFVRAVLIFLNFDGESGSIIWDDASLRRINPMTFDNVAAGECSADVVIVNPVATDNCLLDTFTEDYNNTGDASGNYPVGQTLVTYTATDVNGNQSVCSILVEVLDTEDPTIMCPADVTLDNDPGMCSAVFDYEIITNDNCMVDGGAMQTEGLASGAAFPVGTTTNTYTVSDSEGNSIECSFDVTVEDVEAPTVDDCEGLPTANYTSEAYEFNYVDISGTGIRVASGDDLSSINSEFNAPVTLGAPFAVYDMPFAQLVPSTNGYISTDLLDGGPDLSNDCPLPDDPSTPGTTDGARIYPLHDDLDINLGSDPTAGVFYEYFAVSPVPSPSGDVVGVSIFQWRADHFPDAMTIDLDFQALLFDNGEIVFQYDMVGGEMGSGATVGIQSMAMATGDPLLGTTVSCNTAGSIQANTAVALIPFMADLAGGIPNDLGQCGATITLENPGFMDNCDFVVTNDYTNSEELTAFFPVGATNVTYTATDDSGNTLECSEQILVADTEGPVIECPEPIIINLEAGECSERIDFVALATDNCNAVDEITIVQTGGIASGEYFEPGVSTVTFTATDLSGNVSECSFDVTLVAYNGDVLSALACNDDVNISVDEACNVEFGADMFLEGGPYSCYSDYIVSIRPFGNENLEFIPVGPIDFSNLLGTHEFVVTAPDGNSCWGEFTVEDKLGPEITIEDITVSCIDPAINVAVDATDNCGAVAVNCSDVTVQGSCDTGIDRIITRTCIATDQNGMTSEASATITVTTIGTADINPPVTPIELPCGTGTTPEEITEYFNDKIDTDFDGFPDTEITPTNATGPNCPSAEMFERNEGITFGYFNYPSVGCDGVIYDRQVDNNVCNLYTSYSDQEIPACAPGCGGNVKVIRTWTVLDWCTPDATPFTFVQIIKATDTEAPTIEVADDFGISVNPWNCTGDFSLPAPTLLHDLCTSDLTYTVSGPAGTTLLAPNTTANPSDFWIVFGAEKGLASFTYTAADCCGNTSSAVLTVNVYDTTPPVPVATQNIVLNLTTNGQLDENGNAQGFAKLYNVSVDDGSYDGCSAVKIEIRREESPVACGYTGNSTYATNDDFPDAGDTRIDRPDYDPDNGEYVKFCCEDITDVDPVTGIEFGLVPVRMRVFDDGNMNGIFGDWVDADDDGVQDAGEYDNFNETWVTVRVEGKSIASIVCPPDVTLNCDMDYTDPSMIGTATTLALCGSEAVSVEFTPQVDACGIGFVIATYSVEGSDPLISCNQRIDIENSFDPFDPDDITFPRDLPTNPTQQIACNDDVTFAAPTWVAGACDFIGYTEEVDTFFFEVDAATGVASDACFKILRRFTVIDWCVYDATNGEDGLYFGSQTIKITDREAPVFTDCEPVMFDVDGNCMRTSLELTNTAEDNGECSSDWLKWQVFVDTWGDGVVDYEYSSFLPTNDSNLNNDTNGNGINDRYLAPTSSGEEVSITVVEDMESSMYNHLVTWKVTDGCGNVSSCETTFMVVDKKAPTPYCVSLSTALMQNSQPVELWAIDFDLGAFDNCTAQENLRFTFTNTPPEEDDSYDAESRSSAMSFGNVGAESVNVYVWDEKGNVDFCTVSLTVIDNGDTTAGSRIAGATATELGNGVELADVKLDALLPEYPLNVMTNVDGGFAFAANPVGVDYEVTVNKNDNHSNGVSTLDLVLIQRHIVGFADLDSPYKVIAADINRDDNVSAIDIVELRKVILGVQTEFESNTSWRFVDGNQTFFDAMEPFPVDESREVSSLATDMNEENFVAVKVGDVNATATNNVAGVSTEIRSGTTMILELDNKTVVAGEQVEIAVNSADFNTVSGLQMTMEFNGLSFNDISGKAIQVGASNIGVISDNVITMSWNSNTAVSSKDELFVISAIATKDGDISEMIKISDRVITPEVYVGSSLEVMNVELGIRGADEVVEANELMQNEPNPFKDMTSISFNLVKAGKATLTIRDVAGKLIKSVNGEYAAGVNTISFTRSELNMVGVLYYTLESGNFNETKKMIIIE